MKNKIPDRKKVFFYLKKLLALTLLFGVLSAIIVKLQRIGLFDPEVAVSSFVGVSVAFIVAGLILYHFVYKKLSNSMMGGFL